jgi:hypothetical protein
MTEDKKPFKDTKVGVFLKDKAPKILDAVGDMLPDSGVLGIVKNLVNASDELSPADKVIANDHLQQMYALEVQDRDSARKRQADVSKSGDKDYLFTATGVIGLAVFVFIVYAIVFLTIPEQNKEVWIHLIGISEGVVLSIFGYYFGSAMRKNV